MLSQVEIEGLTCILSLLETHDVISLAKNFNNRLVSVTDRKKAVEEIMLCIREPYDLLSKQKVTKNTLYTYLRNVKGPVLATSSKLKFIMMCLKHWNSSTAVKAYASESMESEDDPSPVPENTSQNTVSVPTTNPVMAVQFSQWFFNVYNRLQDFGPQHFWNDCTLKTELVSPNGTEDAVVSGDNGVASFLANLIRADRLLFDANSSAATCQQDTHGLVRICTSGVVHQQENCVGLFDSAFGLVRNPLCNDIWKIKWMMLMVKVNVHNGVPLAVMQ